MRTFYKKSAARPSSKERRIDGGHDRYGRALKPTCVIL